MKKLLSIITALTVAASATSSLVSCKVITNGFDIEITEYKAAGNLKYTFDTNAGEYVPKTDYTTTEADVKKALDGATGTFASSLVTDMINSLFFNANLSVTQNSKDIWQYLFRTDKEGIYADGQYRTAGLNSSQNEEIDKYYSEIRNITSLLGLMQYSEWTNSNSKEVQSLDESGKPFVLSKETLDFINNETNMFESSNNQGITNVKINSIPKLYEGNIGLATKSDNESSDAEETVYEPINITSYEKKYISKETNYNAKTAKETEDSKGEKGYVDYISGTNLSANFFSQLLISSPQADSKPELDIQVQRVEKQSDTSKENFKKQGLVLNSKKDTDPIVFEYTEDEKGNRTSYAYGYSLIPLAPINLEMTYNNDRDLKTGEPKPGSQNYKINLTIDGLSAAFKPVLSFTSNLDLEGNKTDKDGTPYVGWRFMNYQFNSKNIIGYDEQGNQFTDKPSKKMTATNKKFNDFNITDLTFEKA
ncbi:unknown lipoprotein [Mesoplasma florum L1]|uniref:Lipoprotein n=1 Tax=Mesoplasma florum (strain ATCC 33453 / NBRC 100688 / NCTC 11704 / L1) TaxID=265311 RepID=Q6F232_MESFL|nr:hypothetical protein [Mesoplasma florum]AAT75441.1 unknown lipoprotein [Mesoplasma florum L1]